MDPLHSRARPDRPFFLPPCLSAIYRGTITMAHFRTSNGSCFASESDTTCPATTVARAKWWGTGKTGMCRVAGHDRRGWHVV